MMFATITPLLVTGAFAERVRMLGFIPLICIFEVEAKFLFLCFVCEKLFQRSLCITQSLTRFGGMVGWVAWAFLTLQVWSEKRDAAGLVLFLLLFKAESRFTALQVWPVRFALSSWEEGKALKSITESFLPTTSHWLQLVRCRCCAHV